MGMATSAAKAFKTRLWRIGVACALVASMTQMGCEQRSAELPSIPALPANDTPEGQLARVMQRLDSALETAQAQPGSGVISERRAYHKFIPAEGANGAPTAMIFIETKRALAPLALNANAKAKFLAEAEERGEESPEDPRPLVAEDDQQTEVEQYPLVYEGQRWKLAKELDPPSEDEPLSTEKILFDYALGAN
jgi:hypothetical protein